MALRTAHAWLALLTLAACGPGEARLLVDLRSDYAAGLEVDDVRVEVERAGTTLATDARPVTADDDLVDGIRLAEVGGLSAGPHRVVVRLLLGGVERARRILLVDHPGGNFAVTALVTRDCEAVVCPADGDAPSATECVAGRCVEEGCTPETPERCPAPECAADADCASPVECVEGVCAPSGVCLERLDDSACAADATCSRTLGCVAPGGGCADALSCGLFEPTCADALGRRCLLLGVLADDRARLVLYDPDTGATCPADPSGATPPGWSGSPQRAGASLVWRTGCNTWSMSLETGASMIAASPCGLPAPLSDGRVAYLSQDGTGEGTIQVEGEPDRTFVLPVGWGGFFTVGPDRIALDQEPAVWQLLELPAGTLGDRITEPASSNGIWADGAGHLWVTGRDTALEIVHTDASGSEVGRVPLADVPALSEPFAQYVGVGCAF